MEQVLWNNQDLYQQECQYSAQIETHFRSLPEMGLCTAINHLETSEAK